jgi:hypothetical protein
LQHDESVPFQNVDLIRASLTSPLLKTSDYSEILKVAAFAII